MKALELRPALRLVLEGLVGCWGEQAIGGRMLVWPSNRYLADRTGLSERAVRYAVVELVALRLITPRDSANGKRYVVKQAGLIVDAFGFDLTPLYARRAEWVEATLAIKRERENRSRIFEAITICRRAAEEALSALALHFPRVDRRALEERLAGARRRVPSRRADVDQAALEEIHDELRALREACEQAFYDAGNGGNDCSHIETSQPKNNQEACSSQSRPNDDGAPADVSLALIVAACPALALYPNPIRDWVDLAAAGRYLRGSLGASQDAWLEAANAIGTVRAAIVVAITLQKHEDDVAMRNPGGYFRSLARLAAAGRFDFLAELLALRRKHLS